MGTSSVVSGRRLRSWSERPGSALQSSAPRTNSSQVTEAGRLGSGTSSATGLPLTVTRRRSPASTRRKTPLTLLRSSRAGTSLNIRIVADLLQGQPRRSSRSRHVCCVRSDLSLVSASAAAELLLPRWSGASSIAAPIFLVDQAEQFVRKG